MILSAIYFLALGAMAAVAFTLPVFAGAAPEDAISMLEKRGYTDIEIEPDENPGYQAWACKSGTRFSVQLDAKNNIVDVDPVGHCGAPAGQGPSGDIHVKAPFADVRVGKGRVRVRAPFVDLDIR
ncbi:MAG: PepSY domain-containing protein [Hyphomicrobiaceae bacterium]|nr:PepSY domain-containing protein [Hyphomicrobiaceae bacterium]